MHTRKGGTLENEILFVTVRVGYTELVQAIENIIEGKRTRKNQKFIENMINLMLFLNFSPFFYKDSCILYLI